MAYVSRSQAAQRPTPWIGATTGDPLGLLLLATVYFRLFGTLSPFERGGPANYEGGSLFNQVYWLAILAFAGFVIWRNWGTAIALLRRTWIFLIPCLWFGITMLWSPDFAVSLRRTVLIVLMLGVAFGVAAARPSPSDFLKVSTLMLGALLFFSVLSVVAVPHLARPGGQFIGIYSHKNSAGYVAGITFILWVFLMMSTTRFEMKVVAFFASLIWLVFLVGTMSKTSLAVGVLAPMVGIGLYYVLQLNLDWRIMAYTSVVIIVAILAWIVLYINWTLEDVGLLIFEDLTFTSRTILWEYIMRAISERPLLGHGFGAFWKSGDGANRLGAELSEGWAATAGSAHNGYLNLWLESGLIGLMLCGGIMLLVLRNALDLMKRPGLPALDRWVYASLLSLLLFLYVRDLMEASLYRAHSGSTLLLFLAGYLVQLWRWQSEEQPLSVEYGTRRTFRSV